MAARVWGTHAWLLRVNVAFLTQAAEYAPRKPARVCFGELGLETGWI